MTALHNGKDCYQREDAAYHIYWDILGPWVISVLLGDPGVASWNRDDPNIAGLYLPVGDATGDATVALGEHP